LPVFERFFSARVVCARQNLSGEMLWLYVEENQAVAPKKLKRCSP
jgi:hypothetical protein